jgi:hypothetical protein
MLEEEKERRRKAESKVRKLKKDKEIINELLAR